jgi:hypothetical protein
MYVSEVSLHAPRFRAATKATAVFEEEDDVTCGQAVVHVKSGSDGGDRKIWHAAVGQNAK